MQHNRFPFKRNKKRPPSPNMLYGRHPILEALEQGKTFDKLFIQKGLKGDFLETVHQHLAGQDNVSVQYAPLEKLNRLTSKNHQGIIGFTALIDYYSVEDVLSDTYAKGEVPLFLLCDGITDVGNFGAMARTAACTGVHGIIITAKGSVTVNADALKASAGALHQVAVCKVRFLDEAIKYLQSNGLQVIATDLKGKGYPSALDFSVPTALILGAEDTGVAPKHLGLADHLTRIPIVGNFDSYNVSVATGMLLYEVVKQRLEKH